MAVTAKQVLDVARGWIGYSEANGRFKEILNVYNSHRPLARGYAIRTQDHWCDAFVSAVAIKAGAVDLIGTEVGCEAHVRIFRSKGIWIENGSITPIPGDIILYNWNDTTQPNDGGADHIGLVEAVNGRQITVIEGNYGEAVKRRYIPVAWGYIRGYARPKYGQTASSSPTAKKSVEEVAREVLAGKWGNGVARRNALERVGYNYAAVQAKVNELISKKVAPAKTVGQLAEEVLAGKWGNGSARKSNLEKAGYNYAAVQAEVNKLMAKKSVDTVAREVIAGKWGNGAERKRRLIAAGYDYSEVQQRVNQLL